MPAGKIQLDSNLISNIYLNKIHYVKADGKYGRKMRSHVEADMAVERNLADINDLRLSEVGFNKCG